MDLLNELSVRLCEDQTYRLIIIDSIMALFRTDFCGRGELADRQQKLGQMLAKLTRLSGKIDSCRRIQCSCLHVILLT